MSEEKVWPHIPGFVCFESIERPGRAYVRNSGMGCIDAYFVTHADVPIMGLDGKWIEPNTWQVNCVGYVGGKVFNQFLKNTIEEIAAEHSLDAPRPKVPPFNVG